MGFFKELWSSTPEAKAEVEQQFEQQFAQGRYVDEERQQPKFQGQDDDGVPELCVDQSISGTFGTDNIDAIFHQYAPMMYNRIKHIEDYARVHELEGRIAELQKRCEEQSLIINGLMKQREVNNVMNQR